jgi:hypothetical protein
LYTSEHLVEPGWSCSSHLFWGSERWNLSLIQDKCFEDWNDRWHLSLIQDQVFWG